MNNDKICEYRYMDETIKNNRKDVLKNYLVNNEVSNLNFYELGMYRPSDNIKTKILSNLNRSVLDSTIVLNKYQIELLEIMRNDNLFLSAPTSFGKTFIVLEYIARNKSKLKNVIFIIPTLALMNELLKKVYNYFSDDFNICINASEEFKEKNIFVFVPERCDNDFLGKIKSLQISLLIIDEIYKLQALNSREIKTDDRLIYMNKVYLNLIDISEKVALLGPYINSVSFDKTNLDIVKYFTNYMPVYNDLKVLNDDEHWKKYIKLQHQLIYFSSPGSIYKNIEDIISAIPVDSKYEVLYSKELKYLEDSISKEWYVIELLKRGIGIHHGKTPMFLRKFYENEYNIGNIKVILCTNTLMEGINTPTDSLIIVDYPGSSFKFNNLIGRVGRLNIKKPVIGNIIIASQNILDNITGTNGWFDLKILAETDEIMIDDEVVYLDKKYKDEKKEQQLNEKIKKIDDFGIELTDLINHNLSVDKCYNCIETDVFGRLLEAKEMIDFVKIGLEVIKAPWYLFDVKNYKNLNYQYNILPYKYYIVELLLNKTYKQIVDSFNSNYNVTNDPENINVFIDALYELNNFIKFKFSKFVDYIEISESTEIENSQLLKSFIGILSSYKSLDTAYKILDDLGINEEDSKKVLEFLNITNIISTSSIIRLIRENKLFLLEQDLTPFTINNIKNI